MNHTLTDERTFQTLLVRDLWHQQVKLHHHEQYRGVGLQKFPQDLWIYEKILWEVMPTLVFEIGVNNGGFSLWLADRMRSINLSRKNTPDCQSERQTRLVGLDIDITKAQTNISKHKDLDSIIHLEQADAAMTSDLASIAQKHAQGDDRILVIEDSAHIYETTKASLEVFSSYVSVGSYLVVEDTCVDAEHLRESDEWPRGVRKAIDEFLTRDDRYKIDPINHAYTITCHPNGFLKRVK